MNAFDLPGGIIHLVEFDQSARAEASSDDDNKCAEQKDCVHCVFLSDRQAQAPHYDPRQENGIRFADDRQDTGSENAPGSVEAEVDLDIGHSRPVPSRDVVDTPVGRRQDYCENDCLRDSEKNPGPDCNLPLSLKEVFYHATEEE